ncbi:MAG: NAD(P)/FAD-dependent oxidoreductase, partial [Desulfofustis sp.]|nr:NAD(P)/FAD-dependent oxidoreductase [Desulfofustis sp.]
VMSSAQALALADLPATLLVIGGGYVGLELGMVYAALGSAVTLVEMTDRLLGGLDRDLVRPLQRRLASLFAEIHLATGVDDLQERSDRVEVVLRPAGGEPQQRIFDRVLVAIGRQPISDGLGLEHTGVSVTEGGFVAVDDQQRTTDPQILAVGDVVGGVMLAHKATREGRVAAEVIAGQPSGYDVRAIPAVVYTDPQIAWCGLTEEQAARAGRPVTVQRFPWKYSGRANTIGATDGLTKLLVDPEDGRIIGVGVVGSGAEGLISEGVLAIEMGARAEDLALSLHPHPRLAETEGEAAELFLGSPTHLLPPQDRLG